jgi:hypothetical protein
MNSDLAFQGHYVIQGSFRGFQVWDVSDPAHPARTLVHLCPAMQSDVSVYRNMLFVSGESLNGRLDCGTQGIQDSVSADRLRGIRIYDISDIAHPRHVANVQTCRGSHTHTVVTDARDTGAVFIYVSGQAPERSPTELAGCSSASPDQDTSSALYRLDVIRVPLAAPEQARIASPPISRVCPQRPPTDPRRWIRPRPSGSRFGAPRGFCGHDGGDAVIVPTPFVTAMLDSVVRSRSGSGAPTAADMRRAARRAPGSPTP